MVAYALTVAGIVGFVFSGAYIWWEFGHFARPQVPEDRFDERRAILAYTSGFFLGIFAVLPFLFFLTLMAVGSFLVGLALLAVTVLVIEAFQWLNGANFLLRLFEMLSVRPRGGDAGAALPFYLTAFRIGISAILILGLVDTYLSVAIDPVTVALALLDAVVLVLVLATAALLSLPPDPAAGRTGGGLRSAALVSAFGLLLVGFYGFGGPVIGAIAAGIDLVGFLYLYDRARTILARVPSASPGAAPPTALPGRFGRKGGAA